MGKNVRRRAFRILVLYQCFMRIPVDINSLTTRIKMYGEIDFQNDKKNNNQSNNIVMYKQEKPTRAYKVYYTTHSHAKCTHIFGIHHINNFDCAF